MKLIIKDRAMGKTTQLIYASEITGYPIATYGEQGVNLVKKQAEELGCNIPEPISVQSLIEGRKRGNRMYDNILVDEVALNGVLKNALNYYLNSNVVACTCSPDYTWEEITSDRLPKRTLTVSSN